MNTELNISDIKKMIDGEAGYDFQIDEDQTLTIYNDEYLRDKIADEEEGNNSLGYFDLDECSIRIRYWAGTQNQDGMFNLDPVISPSHKFKDNKIILTEAQKANTERTVETVIFDGSTKGSVAAADNALYVIFNETWKDYDAYKFQFFIYNLLYSYMGFPTKSNQGNSSNMFYYADINNIGFYYKFNLGETICSNYGCYLIDVLDPEGNLLFGRRIDYYETGIYEGHKTMTTNGDESRLPFCHIENNKAYLPNRIPLDIWTMGKPDFYSGNTMQHPVAPYLALEDTGLNKIVSMAVQSDHDPNAFIVVNNYKLPDSGEHFLYVMLTMHNDPVLTQWTYMINKEKYIFLKYFQTEYQNTMAAARSELGIGRSIYDLPSTYDFNYQPNNCRRHWGINNKWYSLLCDGMWNENQNIDTSNCVQIQPTSITLQLQGSGVYFSKNYLNLN